jgi:arginine utilization protein RocB
VPIEIPNGQFFTTHIMHDSFTFLDTPVGSINAETPGTAPGYDISYISYTIHYTLNKDIKEEKSLVRTILFFPSHPFIHSFPQFHLHSKKRKENKTKQTDKEAAKEQFQGKGKNTNKKFIFIGIEHLQTHHVDGTCTGAPERSSVSRVPVEGQRGLCS